MGYVDGTWSRLDEAVWRYEASRKHAEETESLALELTEERCVDSMSGARYPFRAVLIRSGRRVEGCALEGRRANAGAQGR